ncbi:MAG: ABC transporter permease [Candidatus Eremiobacterota bacterium]
MLDFLSHHSHDLLHRTWEHLLMSAGTLSLAACVAVPAGVVVSRHPRLSALTLAFASVVQTVPSLALLGFFMVLTGRIGYLPSLLALFFYSLLPIFQNTLSGLRQVPASVREAATAMGMTPSQVLWEVSVPLALPVIMAGLRTSAVLVIGTATLCAFVGAGGLGVFINRGLETVNANLVLLGVVPVSLIALAADQLLAALGRRLAVPGS